MVCRKTYGYSSAFLLKPGISDETGEPLAWVSSIGAEVAFTNQGMALINRIEI